MKDSLFKRCFQVYIIFFKIGAVTFGGGLSMLPIMQKELVEKRNWISDQDIIDYFAIGQTTPGIIAVNVSTFVGYRRAGALGGVIGTLGIITPSLIIISLLANFITKIGDIAIVQRALLGVNVAVAALLTNISVQFIRKTLRTPVALAEFVLIFLLIKVFRAPSPLVIIGTLLIGLAIHFIKISKSPPNKKE